MEDCIFCKIAKGEADAHKIYEDDSAVAFLEMRPTSRGHTLVIPKNHVVEFQDMSEDLYDHVMHIVQQLARRIKTKYNPKRVSMVAFGLHVPHVHIHLIPLYTGSEFSLPQQDASDEDLKAFAQELK